CKKKKLLDALIAEGPFLFLGRNRVVLDRNFVRPWLLRNRTNTSNVRFAHWRHNRRTTLHNRSHRLGDHFVRRANPAAKPQNKNRRCKSRREANLTEPGTGVER